MKRKLFPNRFTIHLNEEERWALDELYDLDPHLLDEVELLHKVIRAGIKATTPDAVRKRGDPDREATRTEIEARKRSEASVPSVENHVCLPLEARLRKKLEAFLRDHPEAMPEEEAYAMLIDLGLDRAADR